MHVDHAKAGQGKHMGTKDVAVGNDDAEVGPESGECGLEPGPDRPIRLPDGEACLESGDLHRRRHERAARASLGAIRLGDHGGDPVTGVQDGSEGGNRELWCAEEDDDHVTLSPWVPSPAPRRAPP